jgi:hypothetical protein
VRRRIVDDGACAVKRRRQVAFALFHDFAIFAFDQYFPDGFLADDGGLIIGVFVLHALLPNKLEGDVFASGGKQVLADCSLVVHHAVPQSVVLFSFQETHNAKRGCVEFGLVNVEVG